MNLEVYNQALNYIISNPHEWDQFSFVGSRCQSAFCIAGHVYRMGTGTWPASSYQVAYYAAVRLGIQYDFKSQWIFCPLRTLEELHYFGRVMGWAQVEYTQAGYWHRCMKENNNV